MTFAQPWLLALLAAVPLLAWLHRRRSPVVVRVASVAPYRAGPRTAERAERRGTDPLLVALLVAASALSLAAAGPALVTGSPTILVVRDETPSMSARTADGATVGESADARAEALLRDVGADVERWPLRSGEDLAAKVAAARAAGFPGVLLVTDVAPSLADPAVVVVGPSSPARANVAISRVLLDGERMRVVLRNFGRAPVRLALPGVAEHDLGPAEEWTAELAAPAHGSATEIAVRCDDALDADDHVVVRRVGGVRRVRLVGESGRVAAALRALGVEVVTTEDADATVTVGGTLGAPEARSVHLVPRAQSPFGGGLALVAGPREVDAATLVAAPGAEFPLPAPSARLVATGRIAPTAGKFQHVEPLLRDGAGILVARCGWEVAIALDADDPASEWHRDGSFVAAIGASLDAVVGGPERLEAEDRFPAAESDVARDALPAPDPAAARAAIRPGASTGLAAPLAAFGALAAAAAAWIGARRR